MALGAYGGRAEAACVPSGPPGTYACSGPTFAEQVLSGAPLTVTTNAGFSIDTASGDALDLYGYGGLTFTDTSAPPNVSTIIGQSSGIDAETYGGVLSIITNSAVTGRDDDGIKAYGYEGTDLTIIANGNVSGGDDGIDAETYYANNGAMSITATGTVTGLGDDGIDVLHDYGSSLTIHTFGAVTGEDHGIIAQNEYASGALTITTLGRVEGITHDGIYAYNDGTSLTITTSDEVIGGKHGIHAENEGSGPLNISAGGHVQSGGVFGTSVNGEYGIIAYNGYYSTTLNPDGTSLRITAMTVTGATDGIHADNYGAGALSITATGQVTGVAATTYIPPDAFGPGYTIAHAGIKGYNSFFGTDLTITAAGVTGGSDGILGVNYGSGALTISASGPVVGNGAVTPTPYGPRPHSGITAYNSYYGTDLTITAVGVTGGTHGIAAYNVGSGPLSVTVSGNVQGGTGYGIYTATATDPYYSGTFSGGTSIITLNSGATVGSAAGLAIANDEGDSTTIVHAGAHVGGDVRLGNGSDDLTFDGGTFAAGAILDGGDDTGIADGFVDTLQFRNLATSATGGNLQNWENVFIESGASVSFSDNTLTTSALVVLNGGVLEMANGAGENFVLDGNLEVALGGTLSLDVFSDSDFDSLLVTGTADFGLFGEILFNLAIDPGDLFDGFTVDFLTSAGVLNFGDLLVSYTGLDPLYTASVSELNGVLSLTLNQQVASVSEAGAAALFGAGLLGLFGVGLARRRNTAAA